MAEARERPYSQFNFLVNLGNNDTASIQAGFQEVSGLGLEVTVTEYRNGSEKTNTPRKMTTLHKIPDVTLKRGVIGTADLFEWLKEVREGSQASLRTVSIQLQDESHAATVMTWELVNARPTKYTGPTLSGKGTEIAMEELVLACEGINVKTS